MDVVSDFDYQFSRSLRGVPSPGNATHRASVDCWERGLRMTRTVGTGVGVFGEAVMIDPQGTLLNPGDPTAQPTVKVIRDGITRYMPISHFRRERPSVRKTTTAVDDDGNVIESKAEAQARADFAAMQRAGSQADFD